jgi:glycosyltransferase involved in cell wall biosynthesis
MTNASRASQGPPFRVLVFSPGFEPGFRGGGPVRSLARIVDTVPDEIDVSLVTRDRDLGSTQPYQGLSGRWVRRGRSRVFYLDIRHVQQWGRLTRQLRAGRFDLMYVNSLFAPTFTLLPLVAASIRLIHTRRVLIAPRGELSPGALSLKSLKKRIFLTVASPFLKRMNVMWQASTDREAAEIRAVFPWACIEVNANKVSLPYEPIPAFAARDGHARMVFVGRITPKKNLRQTLQALQTVSSALNFDVFGPIEDVKYWAACEALINRMPGNVKVRYRGEILPDDVRSTFSRYDAFIFPTLGENFGHVIAESLSASCPVLCSDETPWTRVLEAGGGIVLTKPTVRALAVEIDRLAGKSKEERLRAREAAGDAYRTWWKESGGPNILDEVRCRMAAHPTPHHQTA